MAQRGWRMELGDADYGFFSHFCGNQFSLKTSVRLASTSVKHPQLPTILQGRGL